MFSDFDMQRKNRNTVFVQYTMKKKINEKLKNVKTIFNTKLIGSY